MAPSTPWVFIRSIALILKVVPSLRCGYNLFLGQGRGVQAKAWCARAIIRTHHEESNSSSMALSAMALMLVEINIYIAVS
ncbi:MAG TPA: hypothetical protein VIM85_11780 [Pseudomonadales bacterium]